mmetsp:Transcript_14897/g.28010  ORF Transcript_14897/g.28010 Transcript_14897/m.28010 type:complete len:100 (+) Transcript_14897:167-466(+)
MCEFCSFGPNTNKADRDSTNPVFSGFFTADAIEAAVRQATRQQEITRQTRKAQKARNIHENLQVQTDIETALSVENHRNSDDDDDVSGEKQGDADDDGT